MYKINSPNQFLVMTTGGTIASTSLTGNDKRYQPTEAGEHLIDKLLQYAPSLKKYMFQTLPIKQMDSKDMQIKDFMDIHDALVDALIAIDQKNQCYKAVIVLCGTDNMENLAFFLQLSLHLKGFKTPIILTGAMLPASSPYFDGLQNLHDAILWGQAIRNIQGNQLGNIIYSAINRQLLSPYLQIKKNTCSLNTFDDANHLATVSNWMWPLRFFVQSHRLTEAFMTYNQKDFTQFPLDFKDQNTRNQFLNWRIEQVQASFDQSRDLWVAMRFQTIEDFNSVDAVIINGTGNGTYPSTWDTAFEQLKQANQSRWVPIIRATQCNQGYVDWQRGDVLLAAGHLTAKKINLLLRAFLTFTFGCQKNANVVDIAGLDKDIQVIINESILNLPLQ